MSQFRAFPFRLLLFAVCLLLGPLACVKYPPYTADPDRLIGQWGNDNSNSRRIDEMPVNQQLAVYPDHIEYCQGNGTYYVGGRWTGSAFTCDAKDGSGPMDAVKITAPEFVQLRLAALIAGNTKVVPLYKEKGSPAEMQALAAKYPPPLAHPPPAGVISVGMSEFQLHALPWQPDQVLRAQNWSQSGGEWEASDGGGKDEDGVILCYHSDNPHLVELRVTVRRHHVVAVNGGNG